MQKKLQSIEDKPTIGSQHQRFFKKRLRVEGGRIMKDMKISAILQEHGKEIAEEWIRAERARGSIDAPGIASEIPEQCKEFVRLLAKVIAKVGPSEVGSSRDLLPLRDMLSSLSRSRGSQGATPSDTAAFIFGLKKPLFSRLQKACASDSSALYGELVHTGDLLDALGLYTTEVFQSGREEVISQQQNEMLELSTPVVTLWDGILALPLIGTLDSNRTQIVMETLLERIVERSAEVAIIDITGVPTVDTLVAQHLIKTVSAAQLMGVECMISGIRPHIAQTIVHLGIDLGNVATLATLADAFKLALRRINARKALPVGAAGN